MAVTYSVSGAPKAISASSAAEVLATLSSAKPGSVITLTETVDPFLLRIEATYTNPGICLVLPKDQIVRTVCNRDAGIEILGGVHSAYEYAGNTDVSGPDAYSVALTGASRIAIRFASITNGGNLIVGGATRDCIISDVLVSWGMADTLQMVDIERVHINRMIGYDTFPVSYTLNFKTDGSLPVDGGNLSSQGYVWIDGPHQDLMQIRGVNFDITIEDCIVWGNQGIVNYGSPSGIQTRFALVNNDIRTTNSGAVVHRGSDMLIEGNTIGFNPVRGSTFANVRMDINRVNPSDRIRAGLNKSDGTTPAQFIGPTVGTPVDLTGPMNGDEVTAPEKPRMWRLPWAPTLPAPVYEPWTRAPEWVRAPKIYYRDAAPVTPPVVGEWLTIGLGVAKTLNTPLPEDYDTRWLRDGVVIAGETSRVYQVTADDVGKSISAELRVTDNNGISEWIASVAVVPQT